MLVLGFVAALLLLWSGAEFAAGNGFVGALLVAASIAAVIATKSILRMHLEQQATDRHVEELHRIVERHRQTSEDLRRTISELERSSERQRRTHDALRTELNNRTERITRHAADLEERVRLARARTDGLIARIDELSTRVINVRTGFERSLKGERRRSNLAVARVRADSQGPHDVVLLMTPQRAASTMVYDMLRTHPCVDIDRSSRTWERLVTNGRRYPSAMSDGPDSVFELEIQPGVGATIETAPTYGEVPAGARRWFLEKAHPEFIDFDPTVLVDRVARIEADGSAIEIVYVVRRPLDAMWSMAEYKRRDEAWYSWLDEADIPEFVWKSYDTILDLARQRPGLILDYDDSLEPVDPISVLGSRLGASDASTWAREAREWVRDRRSGTPTTHKFVGPRDPVRSPSGPDDIWSVHASTIEAADDAWREILAVREASQR